MGAKINVAYYIGKKYNKLTILSEAPTKSNRTRCHAICECGTIKEFTLFEIKSEHTKSCGCTNKEWAWRTPKEDNYSNLTGRKFSRLTVISYHSKKGSKKVVERIWLCECDCGNTKLVSAKSLLTGNTRSCGCLSKEYHRNKSTHGLRHHPLYQVWYNMIDRCTNPDRKDFHNYGAKGIEVCVEWKNDVTVFYNWAINNGWEKGLEIDRKENKGNYEPSNCRFVTGKINARNRGTNKLIEHNGEIKTVVEWSEFFKVNYDKFRSRINMGWTMEKAVVGITF